MTPDPKRPAAPPPTDHVNCPRCEVPLVVRMFNLRREKSEQACPSCGRRFQVPMNPERLPAYREDLARLGIRV